MLAAIEQALGAALAAGAGCIGEIAIRKTNSGFVIMHRDDVDRTDLEIMDPTAIAKFDDHGKYRPLKTAPNLRRGWQIELADLSALARAIDYIYPGRLAAFAAWKGGELVVTSLRETLNRQSGMYRVAAQISDEQIDDVVANFCRSDGGCLRTILWKRDVAGTTPSTKLPVTKFDVAHDQTGDTKACSSTGLIPLICQEACNLLVNECRKVVKSE